VTANPDHQDRAGRMIVSTLYPLLRCWMRIQTGSFPVSPASKTADRYRPGGLGPAGGLPRARGDPRFVLPDIVSRSGQATVGFFRRGGCELTEPAVAMRGGHGVR
jgi:hypothetical protein